MFIACSILSILDRASGSADNSNRTTVAGVGSAAARLSSKELFTSPGQRNRPRCTDTRSFRRNEFTAQTHFSGSVMTWDRNALMPSRMLSPSGRPMSFCRASGLATLYASSAFGARPFRGMRFCRVPTPHRASACRADSMLPPRAQKTWRCRKSTSSLTTGLGRRNAA